MPQYKIIAQLHENNSHIVGYALLDENTSNEIIELNIKHFKSKMRENPNNYVNASLDNFGHIKLDEEVPLKPAFTDAQLEEQHCLNVLIYGRELATLYEYEEHDFGVKMKLSDELKFMLNSGEYANTLPKPLPYVTDMSNLFSRCSIDDLDLSNFDTSKVNEMSYMFGYSTMYGLDLSGFSTSNVTNMSHMFFECKGTVLDLSHFDTINVTIMRNMFAYCNVDRIDLTGFDIQNLTDRYRIFYDSKGEIIGSPFQA